MSKKTPIQDATPNLIHHDKSGQEVVKVWERGNLRSLEFGDGVIQTVLDLGDPMKLPSPVNRSMLASLMFVQTPRDVLLAGAGGGAIARYFQACSIDIRGIAVERSALVAAIAQRFFAFPGESSQWQMLVSDIREYLRKTSAQFDMILVDIGEGFSTPTWIYSLRFLQCCWRQLSAQGVLAINLLAHDAEVFSTALANIRQVSKRNTACLSIEDYKNIMVFAFKDRSSFQDAAKIRTRIPELEQKWKLEFSEFFDRMCGDNPPGSGVF